MKNEQLIKPGTGTTLKPDIVTQDEYAGILSKAKPDTFYSLLGLPKSDKFKNHKTAFTISSLHYSMMEKIRMNLIRTKQADMVRALVGTGMIAMARYKNIASDQIEAAIKIHKDCRYSDKMVKFKESFYRLDLNDDHAKLFIRDLVLEFGNNKFGREMWGKIHDAWSSPEPKFEKNKAVAIPDWLINECRSQTKEPLSDKMFELSKVRRSSEDLKNMVVGLTISDRFMIISHNYGKYFANSKLTSQLLRGYYVCGLFLLKRWVCERRMSKKEYDFYKIIDALDNYAAKS